MKEEKNSQVRVEQQSDAERSEPLRSSEKSNSLSGPDESDTSSPHLHAKTFLAVFSVALIYFAQVFNVVGAGSVCDSLVAPLRYLLTVLQSYLLISNKLSVVQLMAFGFRHQLLSLQSYSAYQHHRRQIFGVDDGSL